MRKTESPRLLKFGAESPEALDERVKERRSQKIKLVEQKLLDVFDMEELQDISPAQIECDVTQQ